MAELDLPKSRSKIEAAASEIERPPFIINSPWSKHADVEGIKIGTFLVNNAKQAEAIAVKRDNLQSAIDQIIGSTEDGPKIEVTHFRNWGDTFEGLLLHAKPKTRSDVQTIVKCAVDLNIKIRGGGGYHTWSPFQPDDGNLLINTCDLELPDTKNPRYKIDKESMTITLSPGVNNAEILNAMMAEGVCFRSSVIIPTTTFGGMLSGGCHGVGRDQTPMSDWMTSMKVVNSKGEVQTIPDDNLSAEEKEEILKAARVNLGVFGIIVEMTIKVSSMENVKVENHFNIKVADIYGSAQTLSSYLKKFWSLHILWIPFNSLNLIEAIAQPIVPNLVDWQPEKDDVYLRGINPTMEGHPTAKTFLQKVLDVLAQGAQAVQGQLMSVLPGVTPTMLTIAFKGLKAGHPEGYYEETVAIPWAIFFRDGLDICYAYDMEFLFPVDIDNPEIVIRAVNILKELTKKYADGEVITAPNKYPFTMFLEARFIATSDSLLCPSGFSQTTGHTACLEVQSTTGTQHYKEFYIELATEWKALGGMPNWHKQWSFVPGIVPYLQERYGDKMTNFLKVRSDLGVDPDNMFVNDTLMNILGLK